MNTEFYENQDTADALMDLMIDQLHHFAELETEESLGTAHWVSSSADRATHF
tara:strand:- start:362 stop:517 length:156 start_codon:yes stop_codon:yes gene_type:complete